MGVTKVKNQAIKLYEESETIFNDKVSNCEWHLDYHNIATCDDVAEIILDTDLLETNLQEDGTFDTNVIGVNTSIVVNTLQDAGASFLSTVTPGMTARNVSDDTLATVLSVDSDTQLTLSSDIFLATSKASSLSWYKMTGDMDIGSGQLVKFGTSAGTASQAALIEKNLLYKVVINITSFSSTVPGDAITFKIGDLTVLTLDETTANTGQFTMLGFNTESVFENFEIECDAGINATFDDLVISKYSNSIFYIVDCETDLPIYYSSVSDAEASITQDQIKLNVDWSNVSNGYDCEGCYYIVVIQDVKNPINIGDDKITNGEFSSDTDWTKGAGWSISGGMANVSTAGPAGTLSQSLNRANTFSAGICYDITFDITYGVGPGEFTILLSQTNGVDTVESGNFSGSGTFTFNTGVLTDNFDVFSIVPGSGVQVYSVDNITAIIDIECTGFRYRTDCYQLSDSHDCTVKLSGTNNDNAFGIDFIGLGYNPTIRVPGELLIAKYKGDKENEEDSSGISKTLYFKSDEKRDLFLYQLPEYLHSFIRLLIGYDTLLIDDVKYVSESSDYAPEAERILGKVPDLSNVSIELRLEDDLNKNIFC